MQFREVFEHLKNGKGARRKTWEENGEYIYYIKGYNIDSSQDTVDNIFEITDNPYRACLCFVPNEGDAHPWQAFEHFNKNDILEEDWEILN